MQSTVPSSSARGSMRAYILMAMSNTSFVVMQLFFKHLTQYMAPPLLVAVRSSLLFLLNVLLLGQAHVSTNIPDPTRTCIN